MRLSLVLLQESSARYIRAPFKTNFQDSKNAVAFDRNMPVSRRTKAWERDGEDKESWFKRKHGHHHALQKRKEEEKKRHSQSFNNRDSDNLDDTRSSNNLNLKQTLHRLNLRPLTDYLFGTNAVLAALKAGKRSYFGRLYIHNPKDSARLDEIMALAKEKDLTVRDNSPKQELNELTKNAVHNGIVLEAKPFEVEEIKHLAKSTTEEYSLVKDYMDGTDHNESFSKSSSNESKYPIGLYLDEISDPHNVGAILRSAYFLGVDFVVISEKNCAPLSPVVSKASSGAMEFMPIYSSRKPLQFFEQSSQNGWNIISTVAPSQLSRCKPQTLPESKLGELAEGGPVLLVVGSEGAGIRKNLINRSDYVVGLESHRSFEVMDESVDSLNVSVATALLISKFLQ